MVRRPCHHQPTETLKARVFQWSAPPECRSSCQGHWAGCPRPGRGSQKLCSHTLKEETNTILFIPYCVNLNSAPQQHRERLRVSPKISQATQNLQHPLHIPRYMKYSLNPKTSYSLSTRSRENSRTLDPKSRKTLSAMSGALETGPCESAPQGQT